MLTYSACPRACHQCFKVTPVTLAPPLLHWADPYIGAMTYAAIKEGIRAFSSIGRAQFLDR
jgi:hypothetical protein